MDVVVLNFVFANFVEIFDFRCLLVMLKVYLLSKGIFNS